MTPRVRLVVERVLPLAVLVAVAAIIRWHNIGDLSLWLDELTQVTVAQAPADQFLAGVRAHTNEAPLDLLGTRIVLAVLGFGTVQARIWAFATGVVTVIAVYGLTLELTGRRSAAFLAGILAAASPILVYYAQESRPYSMSAAMSVVVLWAFARVARSGRRFDWIVFAAIGVAAVYTHYYSALLLLACGAAVVAVALGRWLMAGRTRSAAGEGLRTVVPLVLSGLVVVAAFVPWYLYAARYNLATLYDYPPVAPLTASSGFRMLQRLLTGAPIAVPTSGDPLSEPVVTWALLLLAIVGAAWLLRRRPVATLALVVFAVGLMPFVWWSDAHYGYFVSARQLIFIAPIACVLAAAGLGVLIAWATTLASRLPPRVFPGGSQVRAVSVVLAATIVIGIGSVPGVDRIYGATFLPKEDWRGASAYAAKYLCPGGRVFVNLGPLFAYGVTLYRPDLQPAVVSLEGRGLDEWVVDIMRREAITPRDVVVIFRERPGVFVAGRGDMQTVSDYIWTLGLTKHALFTPRLRVFRAPACPTT